jgi:hypothetical protein
MRNETYEANAFRRRRRHLRTPLGRLKSRNVLLALARVAWRSAGLFREHSVYRRSTNTQRRRNGAG